METPLVIDEKRSVNITLGVLIHFLFTLITIGAAYATIRSDLANVTAQSARNEAQLQVTRELLDRTRMDMTQFSTKLNIFFESYNRDMNDYIRNNKDKR